MTLCKMLAVVAPPNPPESSFIALVESDQSDRALELALAQLGRGASVGLVLATLKALVRANMAGLALRVWRSLRGPIALHPQLDELSRQLVGLPSGEWNRERLERKLRENAAAVLQLDPGLTGHVHSQRQAELRYVVYETASGNRHVIRDDPARGGGGGGGLQFVFPFVDHLAHAAAVSLPTDSLTSSFLSLGVPSHALWQRMISIKVPGGYEPPIDIVETDSDVFRVWLSVIDIDRPLSPDRISFFIGDDAFERYQRSLVQHPWRDPPTHCTINARPGWTHPAIDAEFFRGIRGARAERQQLARAALAARVADHKLTHWRKRFQSALARNTSQPLRVVGFSSRYSTVIQHAMRGLGAAFERCGCSFDLVMQRNASCAAIDVTGELLDRSCDLIVAMNHLRSEYASAIPDNIPYVCWIQDYMQPLWSKRAGRSVGELDLVVGHGANFMSALFDYPVNQFIGTSNLTDAGVYSHESVPQVDRKRFTCDVSYVSHASGTVEALIEEISRGSPPAFERMVQHACGLIARELECKGWLHSTDLIRLMLHAEVESGHSTLKSDVRRTLVYPLIARLYDRMFRHQALEWAAQWARARKRSFKLFGRGWDQHSTLGEFACGEIENGYPLRCLYQASAVNLQVNGYASLHQRLLDAVASGGCVLSRYNPADFSRAALIALNRSIEAQNLRSVADMVARRADDAAFDAQCRVVEDLTGIRIASLDDDRRQAHCKIVRESNGVSDWLNDRGLFNAITTMKLIPARAACDIPNFDQTVFRSKDELHALLDRFVDSKDDRVDAAAAMRESVLKHDTYDGLARKILASFADGVLK